MSYFEHPEFAGHEQVNHFYDEASGLRAIIAIHKSRGTVAGGGIRFFPYANSEDALSDVLRLSKGMTYKSVLAGLPFGGGKSVIIGDPSNVINGIGSDLDEIVSSVPATFLPFFIVAVELTRGRRASDI